MFSSPAPANDEADRFRKRGRTARLSTRPERTPTIHRVLNSLSETQLVYPSSIRVRRRLSDSDAPHREEVKRHPPLCSFASYSFLSSLPSTMKLSVVASLALSATCVVAAPSPKYLEMKGIKRPARKSPVPVANLAVNAVVNSNASVDASPVTANKTNIWASLSNDEAASVVSFLHAQDFLNLTAAEDAGA